MLSNIINNYLTKFKDSSTSGRYADTLTLLDEMRAEFHRSPPKPSEVVDLLEELHSNPRFPGASLVFVAAWFSLSQDYIPLLCEIVSSEELAPWHEQAVELLGELPDPVSVPALTKAVGYRWDFDEWRSVPRKALQSLFAIGTQDALAVVKEANHSDVPEIREQAHELMGGRKRERN
jgi:HEAT repeat protein